MDFLGIAVVTAVAGAFRGLTGFGYALAAALGFAALGFPTDTSVPFILVNDLILTGFILIDRRHGAVDWRAARILLSSGIAGALCGSLITGMLPADIAHLLVALIVMLAAGIALIKHPPAWLGSRLPGLVTGFLVGVFLAAFAVGGPLAAAWLLAGGTTPDLVRGTLAIFFGVVDLFSLVSRLLLGHFDGALPQMLLTFVPITLIGFAAGHFIARRISPETWRRLSAGGLILVALIGLVQAVLAFIRL